jgi:hypothetical protein
MGRLLERQVGRVRAAGFCRPAPRRGRNARTYFGAIPTVQRSRNTRKPKLPHLDCRLLIVGWLRLPRRLVFFLFDLLHLDGENTTALPLVDRKTRLESLLMVRRTRCDTTITRLGMAR